MTLPLVISLPHASGRIPKPMRSKMALNDAEIVDAIDLGTWEIFGDLPAEHIVCAQWSRLVVDLNRSPGHRDEKGVVAGVDYNGRSVYCPHCTPDDLEVQVRLVKYYLPYHSKLEKALSCPSVKGLLDCHSLKGIGPAEAPDVGQKRKDIILGNNGCSNGGGNPARGEPVCPKNQLLWIKEVFEEAGFSVSLNDPYAGGFIVTHYGRNLAAQGKIALQIEINQDLFVDPKTSTLIPEKASTIRTRIHRCIEKIGYDLGCLDF